MPDYEYDIFVSYRSSDEDWVRWTRENFVRPLRTLLRPALCNVQIFLDDQIETGSSWPAFRAIALARSRLLLPILSRAYFTNDWCRLELARMYQRERELGRRSAENPVGLILPVIIDDGDRFPPEVRAMQAEKFHQFANPFMRVDSPRQEAFTECLRRWCPIIEQALLSAPPFNEAWETRAYDDQAKEMFRIEIMAQKTLPALSPVSLSRKEGLT